MEPQVANLPQPAAPASPPSGYPTTVTFDMPASQSRLLALFSAIILLRIILLIPHIIVLYILGLVAIVAAWLNMWVVLFTGHSSAGLYNFAAGTLRWSTRMSAYMYGLTDKYPPFSLN